MADPMTAYYRSFGRICDELQNATAEGRAPRPLAEVVKEPTTERARLLAALAEIRNHLGAALAQALPSDDQIIVGHMRDAHTIARTALAGEIL